MYHEAILEKFNTYLQTTGWVIGTKDGDILAAHIQNVSKSILHTLTLLQNDQIKNEMWVDSADDKPVYSVKYYHDISEFIQSCCN